MEDKITERFIEGLKKYNLTLEEIKNSGWHYCGGDEIKKNGKYSRHRNHFNQYFGHDLTPKKEYACVCEHEILHNCYITDKKRIIVIGSCCVERFLPENMRGRTCEDCAEPHKNNKGNKCNNCRLKMKEIEKQKNKKYCDNCQQEHRNRSNNLCNNCRKLIKCNKCKKLYNKKNYFDINKCDDCRKGYCDGCDKSINLKYKKCFTCKNVDTHKCDRCDTMIDKKWSLCYGCKFLNKNV
jgi:hypothetical protein